jgi:hypothetical protein
MLFGETVTVYCIVRAIGNSQINLNLVRTSQETRYVTATKLSRLILFRKTVGVYCIVTAIGNTQIHINSVRTSQETRYVTAAEPNRLMLFGETVAVYCKNHTEHTDTLCWKNAGFLNVKTGGKCSDHWTLRR